MKISARNKLQGTITRIEEGPIHAQVTLQLDALPTIVAVVTNDAIEDLGLLVGGKACAVVKASSVLLGTCNEGTACGCQGKSA